jgi:hypothetical protein
MGGASFHEHANDDVPKNRLISGTTPTIYGSGRGH